jgi:hypothetical protein
MAATQTRGQRRRLFGRSRADAPVALEPRGKLVKQTARTTPCDLGAVEHRFGSGIGSTS